jgi:hypothetical protein
VSLQDKQFKTEINRCDLCYGPIPCHEVHEDMEIKIDILT